MKSENKEVGIEILDRLADYGVFISNSAPPLNRQKALVLLGEAMLTWFFKEFSGLCTVSRQRHMVDARELTGMRIRNKLSKIEKFINFHFLLLPLNSYKIK